MREFHTIVEFSYNPRKSSYIVRFLDGTCIKVPVENLPAKCQIKGIKWEEAELSKNKDALTVSIGKKKLQLPAHVLYAAGKML